VFLSMIQCQRIACWGYRNKKKGGQTNGGGGSTFNTVEKGSLHQKRALGCTHCDDENQKLGREKMRVDHCTHRWQDMEY